MADAPADTITGEISFDEAIRVEGGEGRYVATVHPSWDGPLSTHGGLLGSIALEAIDREVNADRGMQIRSLSCQYLRPPAHGEIEVLVHPLRRGRRFASVRAEIVQAGRPCVEVLATHAVRDLPEVLRFSPPPPSASPPPERDDAPVSPAEVLAAADSWIQLPSEAPAFFQRLLFAPRFGTGPFVGPEEIPASGTENGGWMLTRAPRRIDAAHLAFLVDVFWPSVLQPLRTPAIAPTLDLTTHFRATLPPEGLPDQPLLVYNNTIAVEAGLADSDSKVFAADGTLLAQGRQLQMLAPFEA